MDELKATRLVSGVVFRSGRVNKRCLTPRAKRDMSDAPGRGGISAFLKMEDALDIDAEGMGIDVSKLIFPLVAYAEPSGHVGIAPVKLDGTIDAELLLEWANTRETSVTHSLTENLLSAVTNKITRTA